jgi:tetratricopeptide (TPR) repeat protein
LLQLAFAATVAWPCAGATAPTRPNDDGVVLERLPARPGDPAQRELQRLRALHKANPSDAGAALDLARQYFNLALDSGDARYVGYAEAALSTWRTSAPTAVPADVLVMRAQLLQYRHRFNEALVLLDVAIKQDPSHRRALAWRAAVSMVMARYESVREDCSRLRELGEKLQAAGCTAYLDATLGKARPSYDMLGAALASEADARPTLRLWTLTVLAEIARRLGDYKASEAHYRAALAMDESDQYVLAAYAELLGHQRRWEDVVSLLRKWERSDVQLLSLARAERALGRPEAKSRAAILRARFADAALRSDTTNIQDEAWFRLEFEADPKGALTLALQNWSVQKEPRDAELVLEAALARRDRAAAAPVLEWMAKTGIEDPRLNELAAQLAQVTR